ncbi:MAG: gamma-glutamylcyclotransferase family protein [Burkholderiales bacterium]|jgi:gamma-glutamylcyclotransferase (GGCT)/AIG2-like uncharacterized protein YtfP
MTTPHCFSYGSLMFREIMEAVADQRDLRNEPASLIAWQRFAIREASYPAACPSRLDASIQGILWFDLSESAWKRLDAFEGQAYRRVLVEVKTEVGTHSAWVYEFLDQALMLSSDWDEAGFRAQHLASFFQQHGGHLAARE